MNYEMLLEDEERDGRFGLLFYSPSRPRRTHIFAASAESPWLLSARVLPIRLAVLDKFANWGRRPHHQKQVFAAEPLFVYCKREQFVSSARGSQIVPPSHLSISPRWFETYGVPAIPLTVRYRLENTKRLRFLSVDLTCWLSFLFRLYYRTPTPFFHFPLHSVIFYESQHTRRILQCCDSPDATSSSYNSDDEEEQLEA
ncbi:hypothetical protein CROQUDRAFT_96432 [Cronartium quercuum f. sp. fusiforme G11]|uniref:Uncharacterized protein n=1 Tax=Cronartium quercuum f. sp. fusiforme G11 TaxID=708437 RepID=A0A9P6T992_9BASI|nr:hypothetical protein CROQUDRAFT_96432 [Cronartium quercuum f. sp. fusiforme G11]